ncbi:sigma-70 family RNA polymerase sigma factor [Rhodanobacter sp. L36]|uniref:sigma-70 family RNA polymerase sigma factor n=1 Tax=Rhodanobacter sp. L36 TaxID=1747221 RepID=UPI00131D42BD|nr:sigma-70 family RNA polymerase sigma factor [Rhodanobacter sp. L36]
MAVYQQGEPAAFRMIYYRYRDRVHRYTLRLAPRSSDAEEVFQDIWMAVIRGRHSYDPKLSFSAWLFSIAHRRAADRWRHLGRHAPDLQRCTDADVADSLESTALVAHETPERHAQNDALHRALLDAVDALPPRQREAFLLKAEGDLSLEDIAIAVRAPRETVKSRLRYAQQRLRDALESWR